MAVVQWNPTMPWRPFQQPWSPFEGLESLRHEMDRLFESFAGNTPPSAIRQSEWMPRVDLLEHDNAFVLVADLPGMQQDDINVSVHDNVLTLEGKRTLAHAENGQGTYHYRERTSGLCCRRFLLSTAVSAEQITATYKNGVLEVHLPKAVDAQPSGSRYRHRTRCLSVARSREGSERAFPGGESHVLGEVSPLSPRCLMPARKA